MDNFVRTLYQERASLPSTVGVLLIESAEQLLTTTDTFDSVLLIISTDKEPELLVKHYSYEGTKLALYSIYENKLREWLMAGSNRKIYDWLLNGKILFDRNDSLQQLIQDLNDFPFHERKLRIGLEFSKLIRRYADGKKLYEQKHYFDAYNHVIHSLHHLARLSLIEKGFHPEVTVWNQVKNLEPEIYKMYNELINSNEAIDKRLELLFLASEFYLHMRTDLGSSHIIEVLSRKSMWSIQEIIEEKELKLYSVDICVLLEYLVDKGYLDIILEESKGKSIYHRYYTTKNF
ncbi:nucleotidyltransferase-like protein [Bacillus andreraoultii]|uniref:nucleotidyltransferase-like protein n=1 Tax=Bacillus andreraoultii TaxID=1499685 RepID=UPI00053B595B|nr:nucleotidyltransferase-like protein [Bacillus andreraoultii]